DVLPADMREEFARQAAVAPAAGDVELQRHGAAGGAVGEDESDPAGGRQRAGEVETPNMVDAQRAREQAVDVLGVDVQDGMSVLAHAGRTVQASAVEANGSAVASGGVDEAAGDDGGVENGAVGGGGR